MDDLSCLTERTSMHDPRANEVSKPLFTRYKGVIVVLITLDTAFSLCIKENTQSNKKYGNHLLPGRLLEPSNYTRS